MHRVSVIVALVVAVLSVHATAQETTVPLRDAKGNLSEAFIEAMLSPGEFADLRITHISEGDEALYCLDSSLSAKKPFVQVYPERIPFPDVGGVRLTVEKEDRRLVPVGPWVTDGVLDAGFAIRWMLRPIGLRFDDGPAFVVAAIGAEVFSTRDAATLMFWEAPEPTPICVETPERNRPRCTLPGISREVRGVAASPGGQYAALGISGVKPRLELYRIDAEPHRLWQSLFPAECGGVLRVSFSADGRFVTALLGDGAIHRFDLDGGRHMVIPSQGRTAVAVPRGNRVLVGARDGTVTLWRLSDGTIDWQLPARTARGAAAELAVSPDGARIATVDFDNARTTIRIWSLSSRNMVAQLTLDDDRITDLAFDRNGEHLYVAHENNGLLRFRVARGATAEPLGADARQCRSRIAWMETRNRIWCAVSGGIMEVDENGASTQILQTGITSDRWPFSISPGGARTVAAAGGHLLVW